jgi:hypothetical protein
MGATVKPPTLSSHLRRPLKRLFKKADRGPKGAGGLFDLAENPCSACSGQKKIPASPLREFCRKDLKSNAFSARIFPKKAEFPANSLRAGNFSPHPASKSRSASASSTDPIWAHPARSAVRLV